MHKKSYLELTRIIAIILVIFHHIDITSLFYHDTTSMGTYTVSLFVTLLVGMDVPLFFMVTGATLLNKQEKIPVVWKKRIPRMITVLVIFSLAQYLFQALRGKLEAPGIGDFFGRLFRGEIQQTYWFLYAYIGLLVIISVLRCIIDKITSDIYIYIYISDLHISGTSFCGTQLC